MNLPGLIKTARVEMDKAGLQDWKFWLTTTNTSNTGECNFGSKTICLNQKDMQKLPSELCLRVLEEEIEHATKCGTCIDKSCCWDLYRHCDKLTKQITKEECEKTKQILKFKKSIDI